MRTRESGTGSRPNRRGTLSSAALRALFPIPGRAYHSPGRDQSSPANPTSSTVCSSLLRTNGGRGFCPSCSIRSARRCGCGMTVSEPRSRTSSGSGSSSSSTEYGIHCRWASAAGWHARHGRGLRRRPRPCRACHPRRTRILTWHRHSGTFGTHHLGTR